MDTVTPPGNGGKDSRGRFLPGNTFGNGRPPSRAVLAFREEFRSAFEPGDIRDCTRKLIEAAKAGDLDAINMIFGYTLGRPAPSDQLEAVAELAERIEELSRRINGGKHAAA